MGRIMAYWNWMVAVTGSVRIAAAITVGIPVLLMILIAAAVS